MYISINSANQFAQEFKAHGRGDQFSYEALEALFEYYDELDGYELDVVGICCDWSEYDSEDAAREDFTELEDYYTIELSNGGILVQN